MQQRELRQKLVELFPRERTYLLPALHYIHHELGHLPESALQVVGWHLHVPASEVYGAATSYTELRVSQPPEHVVRVCVGTPCWLNGGREVLRAFSRNLESGPGGATDAAAGVEEVACLFVCGVAPAAEVDGKQAGRLDVEKVARLVAAIRAMQ